MTATSTTQEPTIVQKETCVAVHIGNQVVASFVGPDCDKHAAIFHAAIASVGTPAAQWRVNGERDPHAGRYDGERAALCMGSMTDDELANEVFLYGDTKRTPAEMMAGKPTSLAYLTAAKDRIRWLSRALIAATAVPRPQDALDAKRYRYVREHFFGADFDYGSNDRDMRNGRSVLLIDHPSESDVSASFDTTIDAAIAATTPAEDAK